MGKKPGYKIQLDVFEGPLDLLLHLINKEEIDIYDIPVSQVTKQYLDYLELMRLLDLDLAGDYLVMAATLMHIKSRLLLPVESLSDEEAAEDPRSELVKRLLEYRKYKEAATELADYADTQKDIFTRRGDRRSVIEEFFEEGPVLEASLFDLITSFSKILSVISEEIFHEVLEDKYTVSDKIDEISELVKAQKKIRFSELFKRAKNKNEIIAMFLALLELIRLREIWAYQEKDFSDIEIIERKPDNPTIGDSENV